jgi:hypothetical protein
MFRIIAIAMLLILAACGVQPAPQSRVEAVPVDGLELNLRESLPVQVSAHVTATLPNGCYTFQSISQERSGNTITLEVLATNSGAEACTMIAQIVDQQVPLSGDFPPGEYIVRAGDKEARITI